MEEGKDGKGRRGSAWQDRDRNQDRGPWGTPLRVGGAVPVQAGSPVCCSAICARNYQRRKCLRPAFVGKAGLLDRKSTRLNSSHSQISYAVFCLKKKKKAIILG